MNLELSEHLPLIASAPDGIQKLRGLILELAVRGKLVPQDLKDEPADALLKRITSARLNHACNVSKRSAKPSRTNIEQALPYDLPAGWAWARLSDLTQVLNGRAYSKDELLDSGTPVLRVGNLFTSNQWYYSNLTLEPDKYCDTGDLIYSWSASFGPFIWQGPKVIYHYHIWKLALFDETNLSKEFFYKFLLEKTAEIKAAGHGVSMIHMTKEKMEKLPVPIPPLAEQHRIVAKVDELMALCDRLESEQKDSAAAHEQLVETLLGTLTQSTDAADFEANWKRIAEHFDTLFTTEASIEALKQTIMQLAVMGKLVPQDPISESAETTIKKMLQERQKLEKAGVYRKSKALLPVDPQEITYPLPTGWAWARLGQIGDWGAGATPSRSNPKYYGGKVPWFKSGELTADFIEESEEYVTEDALKECSLRQNEEGDVLLAMYGATIGKTSILSKPATTNQAVCACTPYSGMFNRYLLLLLKALKPNFIGQGAGGAQPNISREKIIATVFALPPTAEQHRIVAKVDEILALCDSLKNQLAESRQQEYRLAETLIQTSLKAA